ncbi:MAG TPA: GGDEF domain-containing protein [Burkholderiaceae bacterium]|nr:GGDEF domain-containing protein [Burkholderiaceae bacterium]
MSSPTPESPRRLWIGVLAVLLMLAGIALALRAMSHDAEVQANYERALALSQAALEAQHASGDLRAWQARNARELAKGGDAPIAGAELQDLVSIVGDLRERLQGLDADLPPNRRAEIAELRSTLQRFERIGRNGLLVGESGTPISRAALTGPAADIDRFEDSLRAIVADASARATAMARQAERLKETARYGLVGFSLITFALAVVLTLLTLRTLAANRELLERMSRLAQQDGLTGIANRRTLDEAVPVEFARARRSGQPLTLIMLDIDHFKRYNDKRGHAAGDALLRGAAQAWAKQLRPTDLIARYGGEEFTLVLPACNEDQAAQLVDRLRPLMPDRQTFSAGVAAWDGEETTNELVQRADRALLQAKKRGRNRTTIAGRELQATLPLENAGAR